MGVELLGLPTFRPDPPAVTDREVAVLPPRLTPVPVPRRTVPEPPGPAAPAEVPTAGPVRPRRVWPLLAAGAVVHLAVIVVLRAAAGPAAAWWAAAPLLAASGVALLVVGMQIVQASRDLARGRRDAATAAELLAEEVAVCDGRCGCGGGSPLPPGGYPPHLRYPR
jgi:hypothetical protein